jgi:MSHA biogenesis protein MshK
MKQFRVSSSKFQVEKGCVRGLNLKLQTSNFKLGIVGMTLLATLTTVPSGAPAQAMSDPTRPPEGFAVGEPEAAGGGPVLQSVMISAAGAAAIISGQMVKLGQKYGDAVLVKVAESEVVLKSETGLQVLKLYPGVEKRSSVPPFAKTAPRRGGS